MTTFVIDRCASCIAGGDYCAVDGRQPSLH